MNQMNKHVQKLLCEEEKMRLNKLRMTNYSYKTDKSEVLIK